MKRKRLKSFINHIFSFFDDALHEENEDQGSKKKRRKMRKTAEFREKQVPVFRNKKLVGFQILRSEQVEDLEEDERAVKGEDITSLASENSDWAGINSGSETPLAEQAVPQSSPQNERPRWNGMPGWPTDNPEIIHDFTPEDLQASNNKIIIHWAHKVSTKRGDPNSETVEGGRLRVIYCKGSFTCSNAKCKAQERVKVRTINIFKAQLKKKCMCGRPRKYLKCPLSCRILVWKGGARLINTMAHNHDPPAHLLHLLPDEKDEFKDRVIAHPHATPLQLVIGAPGLTGPGKSVADINPLLQNTSRVGVERRSVFQSTIGMGGDSFFQAYERLQRECPGFVRKAVIGQGPVTVICFQTKFMRSLLVRNGIIDEPINGIVTDGAHKFFRHAILIITSTFALDMSRWVPGLFSYSNGATAAHYAVHFTVLFESIAEECEEQQMEIVDELFAGVMDFSDAQRLGFIQAFVDFWKAQPQNTRTVEELRGAAPALLRGCQYHFQKTVTRISKINAVIPPDRVREFKKRTRSMFEAKTDKQFRNIVEAIIAEFPLTKVWLKWWLLAAHAAMLFPSQRKMKSALWDSLPSTTNAEESIHNTLRIGHGIRHEFFQGSYALYGHSKWLQKTSEAENAGVPTKYGAKEPHKDRADRHGVTKPRKRKLKEGEGIPDEENDRGRPPDTVAELLPWKKPRRKKRSQQTLQTRRKQLKAAFKDRLEKSVDKARHDILNEQRKASRAAALKQKLQSQNKEEAPQASESDSDSERTESHTDPSSELPDPGVIAASKVPTAVKSTTDLDDSKIPSYPFNRNSCWLDTSLSLLYAAVISNWADFNVLFASLPEANHLHSLFLCLESRYNLEVTQDSGKLLGAQRDAFRNELIRIGAIHTKKPYDYQPLWSWLPDTARKAADKVAKTYAPCAYLELLKTEIHTCGGCESTNGEHVQIITPARRELLRQLSRSDHDLFGGSVDQWFRSLLSLDREGEYSNCWRVLNSKPLCDGRRRDIRHLVLSIPVILIIEVADDGLEQVWNFPETLYPSHVVEAVEKDWEYELVGLAMHSKARGHFIGRFASSDRTTVYAYDDLVDSRARAIPNATVSSHLAGTSIPLHGDYKVCSAIYCLSGGTDAQLTFFRQRKEDIASRYNVKCFAGTLEQWPQLDFTKKGFKEMDPSERSWMSNPFAAPTQEYVKEGKLPRKKPDSPLPPESEDSDQADSSSLSEPPVSPRSPKTPSKPRPLDTPNNTPTSNLSGSNEDFEFACRCGLIGDANALYRDEEEGKAISCDICSKWVHVACQRNGRAHGLEDEDLFLCDKCDPGQVESRRAAAIEQERYQRAKLRGASDLPPLHQRLKSGIGALVQCGVFWYPVRLIQQKVQQPVHEQDEWTVRWWRGCQFESAETRPGSVSVVSQDKIVDSLWLDRVGRRRIRLGKWTHPSYGYDETEEILSDPSSVPYTDDVHTALLPHQDILSSLLNKPESIGEGVRIPAKPLLEAGVAVAEVAAYKKVAIGGVSVTDQARIANWFETHISKDPKLRPKWVGLLPMTHAITLYLADQMYQEAIKKGKLKNQTPDDFIAKAWELQKTNVRAEDTLAAANVVDVDAECLAELEEQMFERSEVGGLASYYQWGLDAGDHQRSWDPWDGTPSSWCRWDFPPWSEDELERGPDYVEDQVSDAVEAPKVTNPPKPRPVSGKRKKLDVQSPPESSEVPARVRRKQPPRKGKT